MLVVEKIYEYAQRTPDKTAVVYNNRAYGFAQFYRLIAGTRGLLQTFDLKPGTVAAVWVDNLFDHWVLNLALRSLGLITIAIQAADEVAAFDPDFLACVIRTQREAGGDSGVGLPSGTRLILLSGEVEVTAAGAPLDPPPAQMGDGGHIMLTSATTGAYKKVWLEPHQQLKSLLAIIANYEKEAPEVTGDQERLANILMFGLWTASGYNTPLACWVVGNGVVIHQGAQPWRSFDYPGITHAVLTPAFLQAIVDAPEGELAPQPQVQIVVVGGALSLPLARRVRERLSPRIATTLGSTEGGSWAITPVINDDDLRYHRLHPGRVVQVVGEDDQPLAPGALGHLRVNLDESTASAYLGDEAASAAVFRGGWFYPGDLAIMREDGRLSLHGRASEVINILGDKKPAEPYERAIQEGLDAEDVCVFALPGAEGDELHVVIQTKVAIEPPALKTAIAKALYGFPRAHVHFVEAMPRNHMGKVLRLSLKQQLMAAGGAVTPLP